MAERPEAPQGPLPASASRPVHATFPFTSAHASTPLGEETASIGLVSPRVSSAEYVADSTSRPVRTETSRATAPRTRTCDQAVPQEGDQRSRTVYAASL